MSPALPPRVALVTGGANGIGKATAHKLASRGIAVVICDRAREEGSKAASEIAEQWRVKTKFVELDVTNEEQVKQAVQASLELTGRLDYAANCAGICETNWKEEESITTELFDRTYAVNTRGLWLCQKHEALQMAKQEPWQVSFQPSAAHPIAGQRGAIANTLSIASFVASGLAAYTPSKHAALAVTRNGARFYGPSGIRVNGVCPAWTMTAMTEATIGAAGVAGSKENKESSLNNQIPLGRMSFAEEQANVMSFLLSDESSFVHGTFIVNDGGYTLGGFDGLSWTIYVLTALNSQHALQGRMERFRIYVR